MRLIIVRHGKAAHDSPDGTDFARPLRGRGVRQAAYLGERFGETAPRVTRIIASRAERARHTASIIGDALGVPVEHDDALLVDEPVGPVVEQLASWMTPGGGALVVVGHNPQLERLASVLGSGPTAPVTPLRTGEAVVIDLDPDNPTAGREIERIRLEES